MAHGLVARLEGGGDGVELDRGVQEAVRAVVTDLGARSEAVDSREELQRVGTTAALGDDELGRVAAEALTRMGKDAPVVVMEGDAPETVLEPSDGLRFPGTRLVPDANAVDDGVELADALVIISEQPVPGGAPLVGLLEKVVRADRPLRWWRATSRRRRWSSSGATGTVGRSGWWRCGPRRWETVGSTCSRIWPSSRTARS